MLYEIEKLNILGERKDLFIFDYYDGVKGECNLEEGIILFWHDYTDEGEVWFYIETQKDIIKKFLNNEIPALDIFKDKNSKIYLFVRKFDDYQSLKYKKKLSQQDLENYDLPNENAFLGYSVLDKLNRIYNKNVDYVKLDIQNEIFTYKKSIYIPDYIPEKNKINKEQARFIDEQSDNIQWAVAA